MIHIDKEMLNTAIEYGILNEADIRMQVENMEIQRYLAMHPYEIFESCGSWWTYLPDKEKGRVQKKRKNRADIEKLIIDFYREETENPTVKEIFDEWNTYNLECGNIKNSTYDRNVDYYKRHFTKIGISRIKNIQVKEWAEFLKEQVYTLKLKKKAYNGLHQVTFNLLKYAKIKGFIDFRISEIDEYIIFGKNTFRDKEKQKELEKAVEDNEEVFSVEETEKILRYLINHLDKQNLGILLMFLTGMRIGEVSALKKVFVKDDGVIMVRHSETKYRDKETKKYVYKTSEVKTDAGYRDIVLPEGCEWICKILKGLNTDSEYVFTNKKGRMTTNCFRRRQKRICEKLGIEPKPPHKDRKTYATILTDLGIDKNFILKQMGHTDIETTEAYYHRDRKTTSKKAQMLGKIEEFNIIKNKAI